MAACCGGNVQALQALLQSGVSVNHASGSTMASLLHMAAYCGQVCVCVCVCVCVRVCVVCVCVCVCVCLVNSNFHVLRIFSLLPFPSSTLPPPFPFFHSPSSSHHSPLFRQLPVLLFLMRSGANWKAVDEEGDTVLHFACMKEVSHGLHDRTLEFLLATPIASLKNAQNVRGDTPINVATRCAREFDHSDMLTQTCLSFRCQFVTRVKMLLRCKADVTIANSKKELPLHRACGSDKNIEVCLCLHFSFLPSLPCPPPSSVCFIIQSLSNSSLPPSHPSFPPFLPSPSLPSTLPLPLVSTPPRHSSTSQSYHQTLMLRMLTAGHH